LLRDKINCEAEGKPWTFESSAAKSYQPTLSSHSSSQSLKSKGSDRNINSSYYGGGTDDGQASNEMFELDLDTLVWSKVSFRGDPITGRMGHYCVMLEDNTMLVFGGNDNSRMLADSYSFNYDTKTWKNLRPSGDNPVARTAHNGVRINQYVYTYGGIQYYGDKWGYLDDLHRYDIENNVWEKISYGGFPLERRANFICAKQSKIILLWPMDTGNFIMMIQCYMMYHPILGLY